MKNRLNKDQYFIKRTSLREKLIKSTNWVEYWNKKDTLDTPQNVATLDSQDLIEFHEILCYSLKQFIQSDLENTNQAKTLHDYYLQTKKELIKRGYNLPQKDSFEYDTQNKQKNKAKEERMEEARQTCSFCPFCNSTNTFRNGNMCGCSDCKKNWRRHK